MLSDALSIDSFRLLVALDICEMWRACPIRKDGLDVSQNAKILRFGIFSRLF